MPQSERLKQIEALLAADPADTMLRYMLGMEQASAGHDEAAVATFRAIIADEPYVPAFHMASQALIRLGRPDEAAAMLRAGIDAARQQNDLHALGEMDALLATLE